MTSGTIGEHAMKFGCVVSVRLVEVARIALKFRIGGFCDKDIRDEAMLSTWRERGGQTDPLTNDDGEPRRLDPEDIM